MKDVFDKISIGTMTVKNRLMMSAMVTNYCTEQGEVTERLIDYHVERAKGGVGLIETEAAYVHPGGKGYARQLGLYRDDLVTGLRQLVNAIHHHGASVSVQLHHAGRRTSKKLTGYDVISPSSIACFQGPTPPKGMIIADDSGGTLPKEPTINEIEELIRCFISGAQRAKQAGSDAVCIHAAHGYLVNSFLSPFTNKRQDGYGGDLERRCRFLIEILQGIRRDVGDIPILVKLTGEEFVPGGLTLQDTKVIAPMIEKAGANALIVSAGTVGESDEIYPLKGPSYSFLRSLPMATPRGSYLYMAEAVKKTVTLPVITVGRINSPTLIRDILQNGKADMVALGRALLADPCLPKKMNEGKEDDIRTCIACNQGCFENLFHQQSITCALYPTTGREKELQFISAREPKRIVIIGGGPAGMEIARISSNRGHSVALVEKNHELGGQLRLACKAPHREEIENYLSFLEKQLKKTPTRVLTDTPLTQEHLRNIQPDILVFATGGRPWIPAFVTSDQAGVWPAEEILEGHVDPGDVVAVAGGGLVGCEVAELLGEQGKKVTLIEMLPDIVPDEFSDTKKYFANIMAKYDIEVCVDCRIESIANGEVRLKRKSGASEIRKVDGVVLALGYVSNVVDRNVIPPGLQCKIYEIGDCVKPRKIIDVVYDAYRLALSL
jgi:2,4-dienoyl-CoA reductase-like NADH-dependent reductase (Old Yellow Enzyme family)/thioredoxin reductase